MNLKVALSSRFPFSIGREFGWMRLIHLYFLSVLPNRADLHRRQLPPSGCILPVNSLNVLYVFLKIFKIQANSHPKGTNIY